MDATQGPTSNAQAGRVVSADGPRLQYPLRPVFAMGVTCCLLKGWRPFPYAPPPRPGPPDPTARTQLCSSKIRTGCRLCRLAVDFLAWCTVAPVNPRGAITPAKITSREDTAHNVNSTV